MYISIHDPFPAHVQDRRSIIQSQTLQENSLYTAWLRLAVHPRQQELMITAPRTEGYVHAIKTGI